MRKITGPVFCFSRRGIIQALAGRTNHTGGLKRGGWLSQNLGEATGKRIDALFGRELALLLKRLSTAAKG